jgi:PAS domain S-box-containing protein
MSKILIVDDDPNTRELYVSLLTPFGHEVIQAGDGEEGLDLARQWDPDLIVSDILMPTTNGYEFVSRLRQVPQFAATPVIFQSASFLDHQTQLLGRNCGVSDFIAKPCDPEEILATINRVLKLPSTLPVSAPLFGTIEDPVPLVIDAYYEKGKKADALSLRLSALLELGLQLARSTEPLQLLEAAASVAREVIGANYSAAATLEGNGPNFRYFITRGIQPAASLNQALAAGTFREIAVEGKSLRVFSPVGGPSSLALPSDHPPVHGFLGTPIQTGTRGYGLIYVADKLGGLGFTPEDEGFLATIATKLAVAYENVLRYHEIQEHAAKLEREVEHRKQAEDRFRLLVETAPTGILICDAQGSITEANAQVQRMFGYTREELIGHPVELLVPEQHRGAHVGHRTNYVNRPQARPMGVGMELHGRRKDGTPFPLEISLGPLVTSEGAWISSTVVDISERKKLEQQLQVSQRLEAVGQLAAGIAHDFNNILTAITGNAKLALNDLPADHPVHRNLAEIEKASLRATLLVRQILTFGRQEAPKRQVIKLAPVVEEALKLLRAGLRAGIEIRTHFDDGLPDVLADSTQIHQIIMNLGTNAADAMGKQPVGVLEIRSEPVLVDANLAHTTSELQPGSYLRLTIRDSGCGMDKATTTHIFEPFYTTKPQGEGTGLGLSVVHGIMKTHGGAITVYSELGKGTVFHLYFPAAQGAAVEARPQPTQREFRGHNERVLYVDDEEPLVFVMGHMLQRLGYKVTGCTDPHKALETFRSRPDEFDVVVSDLSMPGVSGLDLARELLQIRPGIPILLASGIHPSRGQRRSSQSWSPRPDSQTRYCRTLGEILHKLFEKREEPEGGDKTPEEHTLRRRQAASSKG